MERKYEFLIQLPMDGGTTYDLCKCTTPQMACAVIEAMLKCDISKPEYIRVYPKLVLSSGI